MTWDQLSRYIEVTQPVSLNLNAPFQEQTVTASFRIRNTSSQPVTLRYLVAAVRTNCGANWDCSGYDFPPEQNVTIPPGQDHLYQQSREFSDVGDYWAAVAFLEGTDWQSDATPGNGRAGFSVTPGIQLSEDLNLSDNPTMTDQMVTAHFTIRNNHTQAITLRRLIIAVRGPGCGDQDWNCARGGDFPYREYVTSQPGATYTYEDERGFHDAGAYFARAFYSFGDNDWHPISRKVDLTVAPGLQLQDDLGVWPLPPYTDEAVTARFRIKNIASQPITLTPPAGATPRPTATPTRTVTATATLLSAPTVTATPTPTLTPGSTQNLAYGKAATQSSTASGGDASRAVDGDTATASQTNNEYQARWQVDLGATATLSTIEVWNRADCCTNWLSGFYVLVSNDPMTSPSLTTTMFQTGVSYYYVTGPAGRPTTLTINRTARYVRVQLMGIGVLSLAEVRVAGR